MEFFDKLSSTIMSTGRDVTKKTKDLTEVAKLKMEIHSIESDVNDLYAEIGKRYYKEHKNDEEAEYDEIQDISIKLTHLKMLNKNVMELKNVQTCPKCGTEVKRSATYCSVCGEKLGMYEDED